ncbi:MAG: FAD-binding oxidoreductase [Acidiferrobacterales bacterium]|nr:FAD-binding oxidoreductase [Acidiferrobacterales bacterium]
MSQLISSLATIVGSPNVLTGEEVTRNPKSHWDPSPLQGMAIVKPENTEEVSAILKACYAAGQSVVTHGGVTGLADGDHSTPQDIILSMVRMNRIESIDKIGQTVSVEAGCILAAIQNAAEKAGLQYGVDLGARGSCTIGGNIATNAGGLSVLRYGMTREQILGLEVVLANGTVMSSMNEILKNNAGYDLKQLFIGSEGTLGVVTKAVLRLRPSTPCINTAILAFQHFDQVTRTLEIMSHGLNGQLNAYEVMWNEFYCLGTNTNIEGTIRPPLPPHYPFYAILESQGGNEESDRELFESVLGSALEERVVEDAVVPQSERGRASIWRIRENVDIVLSHDPKYIYDVSLPINAMPGYLDGVRKALIDRWPEVAFYVYGHLADGNLHLIVAPKPSNLGSTRIKKNRHAHTEDYRICNEIIYQPLGKLHGSISAEHGIGLEKKNYMALSRNSQEVEMMRLFKQTLDPANILNPGKIV